MAIIRSNAPIEEIIVVIEELKDEILLDNDDVYKIKLVIIPIDI